MDLDPIITNSNMRIQIDPLTRSIDPLRSLKKANHERSR